MALPPLFLTTPNPWLLLKRLFDASSECLVLSLQNVSMLSAASIVSCTE